MDDNEFCKKYEAYEREALRETIAFLIEHRQNLRDKELTNLEAEASTLLRKIESIKKDILAEEIKCFKEILALQRRLLENGQ